MSIRGSRPVALALGATAMLLGALGALELGAAVRTRVRHEATLDGLAVRVADARWVRDEMQHDGSGFPMPTSMLPDLPAGGLERLTAELRIHNQAPTPRAIEAGEFRLRAADGASWNALPGTLPERLTLAPGAALDARVSFDHPAAPPGARPAELALVWRHGSEESVLAVPPPPVHDPDRAARKVARWPESVSALPDGRAEAGWFLYSTRFACVACHGLPGLPGSSTVGPHLGGIGNSAVNRVSGASPAQYLYDSLVRPGARIAPGSASSGAPWPDMPLTDLDRQEAADLVAYLLEQVQPEQNPGPAHAGRVEAPADERAPAPDAAARGAELYARAGCAACHGDPREPGGATRGPELAGIAARAGTRVPGQDARAYLHEALTRPAAFVAEAPLYQGERLTSMPETPSSPAETDDLVAFLLEPVPRR